MASVSVASNRGAGGAMHAAVDCGSLPVSVRVSRFVGAGGVEELQLIAAPTDYAGVDVQLDWLDQAYRHALETLGVDVHTAVVRRLFASDPVNQADVLGAKPFANPRNADDACAVSWVGQAPMGAAKVALWAYHVVDPAGPLDKVQHDTTLSLRRGDLVHHWTTAATCAGANSHEQTDTLLHHYTAQLRQHGMTLADHVLRTWFFVRDIDANYAGLVQARRAYFATHGLTPETHYIASSGIEGISPDPSSYVLMDAYAVQGISPEAITYIKALDHLSPTHTYGVTFERATAVDYRDRRHVLISGTASIDHQGQILHPGDVVRQLDRTLENVEALMAEAGGGLADLGGWIVYLRDAGDAAVIEQQMRDRVGEAPMVIVHAPVCRPGWLVEVEGIAALPHQSDRLPAF